LNPKVDPDLCIGCGLCAELCPEVFEMGDDGLAHAVGADQCEDAGCCEEAADSCPVDAISL
jgi:ferredoxin